MNEQINTEQPTFEPRTLSGILRWMGMSVFVGAVMMGVTRRAAAATTTVSSTADSGANSLRDAVTNAAAGDTIDFNLPNGSTINLQSRINIDKALTISGPGAANLTIGRAAGYYDRLFNINDGTGASINVTISGLTLSGGSVFAAGSAVLNVNENLTITNSTISGNSSFLKAAVASYGGSLTIQNSTLDNNNSQYYGGAIFVSNTTLTIQSSTLSNNSVSVNNGGALYANYGSTVQINDTTISGNTANGNGGAIFLGSANLTIRRSTLSGNSAAGSGGGIASFSYGANLTLENSTISGNNANGGDGGGIRFGNGYYLTIRNSTITGNYAQNDGGGIFNSNYYANLDSTIVGGNYAASYGGDLRGRFYADNTLVQNQYGFNVYGSNNIINQDPRLGPLQNNGGPTFSHALLAGSPCLDTGSNPAGLTVDQRGLPRVSGAAIDMGAVEAQALSLVVKNLNDAGPDSLRQCVLDSNAGAAIDSITFEAGLTGTITLTTGELAVTDSVAIQGPGAATIAVSGNNVSRVVNLYNGSSTLEVTISGLTIRDGSANIGAGVINFDEHLTLSNCVISNNAATGDGGGIWADGFNMSLLIDNCTITGNSSGDDGGGIYVEDTGPNGMTFRNSVFSNNTAVNSGGGIYLYDPDSDVTIDACTISGNTAGTTGGGIYLYSFDNGTFTIRNSTISNNSATVGGGIYLYSTDHPTIIENCTVSGNQATAGSGGGIAVDDANSNYYLTIRNCTITLNTSTAGGAGFFANSGTPLIQSTIVAGNQNTGVADDFNGTADGTSSFNIVGVDTGVAGMTDGINSNQVGTAGTPKDPQLGPLQNNGGPTLTHAIDAASIAHNTGLNPNNLVTDQRGTGFRRVSGFTADVGAFEFQDPPTTFVVRNLNDSGVDSLRDCVLLANSNFNIPDIITFEAGLTGSIILTSGQITITDSVSIQGPGVSVITVDGNATSRIFNANDYDNGLSRDITISGLTLTNADSGPGDGGAILVANENLSISNSVLSNNKGAGGGAIKLSSNGAITGGSLTITNSTLSGNSASNWGGALYIGKDAPVSISNSTISGNSAASGGGMAWTYSDMTIVNSTISGNSANGGIGGAIATYSGGTIHAQNSTFSGNRTVYEGGALFIGYNTGLILENCTITNNVADATGGNNRVGGGLFLAPNVAATISSTIVAGNTHNLAAPVADDISGPVNASSANNIVGVDTNLTGITNGTNSNQIGTAAAPLDPKLGALADNGGIPRPDGGNVQTHALLAGSPALDTGSNPANLTTDGRGAGFARVSGPAADVGAFENQVPVVINGGPYTLNEGSGLTLNASATDADNDTLTFSWDINGDGTFGDATGANPTLDAAALSALGIADGPKQYNVALQVNDGKSTTTSTTTLDVLNVAPTIAITGAGANAISGTEIILSSSTTDPSAADTTAGFTYSWTVTKDGVAFASGTTKDFKFTPNANGSYVVTVTATDKDGGVGTDSKTIAVTTGTDPNAPIVNQPIVVPNPPVVGEPVTITVSAQDPNNKAMTFTYDWGDGTSSSSNTHIYDTPGTYTVTITVTNGTQSSTQKVTIGVVAGRPNILTKVKGVVHFANPGNDTVHVTTILPDVAPGFSPAGKPFTIDVGGIKRTFTLDARGKARSADGSVSLQMKRKGGVFPGGPVRMLATLKGSFAADLKDEGVDPAKPTKYKLDAINLNIFVTVNGATYFGIAEPAIRQSAVGAEFHTTHNKRLKP